MTNQSEQLDIIMNLGLLDHLTSNIAITYWCVTTPLTGQPAS